MSMTLPKVLKAFAITAAGAGLVGKGEGCKLPSLKIKTDDVRTGGMDAAVKQDMGQEDLEFDFTLKEYEPRVIKLWGLNGAGASNFVVKGHAVSATGDEMAVVATMQGRLDEVDGADVKAGSANDISFKCSLVYYKLQLAGEVVVEIDILNGKRIIGGVDVLASQRANLGI